jgi:hypothetical protein
MILFSNLHMNTEHILIAMEGGAYMSEAPKHTVLVSLPVTYYACLARMVANRILRNPTDQKRVATICREIICEYVDRLNQEQSKGENDGALSKGKNMKEVSPNENAGGTQR